MDSRLAHPTLLSNDFRLRDGSGLKTPEPPALGVDSVDNQSLPPSRPRLKLKRRHVSQLSAPTQHFLASIAAADVPIPSIEGADLKRMDVPLELHVENFDDMDSCPRFIPRLFSPPKTPAVGLAPSPAPTKYPDWYCDSAWSDSDVESDLDDESSRPSTAFSTKTSSSLFSLYSSITDDNSCISPDQEATKFPHNLEPEPMLQHPVQDKEKLRKAPWTRAMSSHLWATYMLYLSDPRVTPIHFGKSCIPPHGVCARVARQAQRSWKKSKLQSSNETGSGSCTPTAQSVKTYIRWPHTAGATRAHLRELCKIKATNRPGRYSSRSPAPFSKSAHRRWNRRSTAVRASSVFSAQDMAMSLALSTSDTMQPHGPLAQLTGSQPPPISVYELQSDVAPAAREAPQQDIPATTPVKAHVLDDPFMETGSDSGRLGSPFLARSYGPSSTSSMTADITLPKKPNTVGPRRFLKSPVRLNRSRSGAQKRRSTKGQEEKPWRRPSLAAAFFRASSRDADSPLLTSSATTQFISGRPEGTVEEASSVVSGSSVTSSRTPQTSPPRALRLGSPFSGPTSSHSFPNRLSSPASFSLTAFRRPFATVQQSSQLTSDAQTPTRSSLASRLAYLDQRLKELRNRGTDRRRSQSPF